MSYTLGCDLPHGTVVYYKPGATVFRTVVGNTTEFEHIVYNVDSYGIWASELAREFWKDKPESHPMCTLFDVLYKKLEPWNLDYTL